MAEDKMMSIQVLSELDFGGDDEFFWRWWLVMMISARIVTFIKLLHMP